jgi:sulfoacetaldehyde dehydrogenase
MPPAAAPRMPWPSRRHLGRLGHAKVAGINLPKGKSFLMVEETGIGKGFPFSAEKLSVTMTLYKYKEFPEAVELVNRITAHSGPGRS